MASIYDNAFHTIINDCSKFLIPYINEVFGENYSGDEEVVFHPNEHYISKNEEPDVKRITDSFFSIIGKATKKYHLECESSPFSAKIMIRLFEYDAQIALDSAEVEDDTINVSFPNTTVLYLRSGEYTPDSVWINLTYPGGEARYSVTAVYLQSYSLEEIFKKKLYILLPFYLFNYEKRFDEIESNDVRLDELTDELKGMFGRLEGLIGTHEITSFDAMTIMDLMRKVSEALLGKRENISKRMGDIMGGHVIMTEAKEILNQGIEQGLERGLEQGRKEKIRIFVDLVNDRVLSLEEAAKRAGMTVDEFKNHIEGLD